MVAECTDVGRILQNAHQTKISNLIDIDSKYKITLSLRIKHIIGPYYSMLFEHGIKTH